MNEILENYTINFKQNILYTLLGFEETTKPSFKVNGPKIFLIFAALFALAQFAYPFSHISAFPLLLFAFLLFGFLLVKGNTNDLFLFLFFTSLTRIVLPNNFREVSLFFPIVIGPVLAFKNSHKFISIKRVYVNSLLFLLFLFFGFMFYQIINEIQLPGFIRTQQGNSGFLTRWSLVNNIFVFISIFVGFNMHILKYLIEKIYIFYAIIFIVSLLMLLTHINSLPLFNTFSWSVVIENASSKKMIIAGTASIMLLIYLISFQRINFRYLMLALLILMGVAISGSRTAFLSYFLIVYFGFMIYKRGLLKGMVLLFALSAITISLLLSPLILLIPQKYQRLVIIFPSEFYSNSLHELKTSSAANSSNFRYEMWTKAFVKIKENPLFGSGIGVPKAQYDLAAEGLSSFHKIDPKTLTEDFMKAGSLHNTFVSIAYSFGLPAVIVFLSVLIMLLLRTYKLTLIFEGEQRAIFIFFTLIVLNYIIQTFMSDIHNNMEFYVFLAIIIKSVLIFSKPTSHPELISAHT